jgi:hypothetical protein
MSPTHIRKTQMVDVFNRTSLCQPHEQWRIRGPTKRRSSDRCAYYCPYGCNDAGGSGGCCAGGIGGAGGGAEGCRGSGRRCEHGGGISRGVECGDISVGVSVCICGLECGRGGSRSGSRGSGRGCRRGSWRRSKWRRWRCGRCKRGRWRDCPRVFALQKLSTPPPTPSHSTE